MQVEGLQIQIRGVVQGVGLRPFVYRVAQQYGIAGYVTNEGSGVRIEAYGTPEMLECFTKHIRNFPPPLAMIRSLTTQPLPPRKGPAEFLIVPSARGESVEVDMARDTAVCDDCHRELFSRPDRRYRHPFINCTNCGPRYTIIRELPYDRARTSMSGFQMCPDCRREYESPGDRRFHAQPVCCNRCGPALTWFETRETDMSTSGAAGEGPVRSADVLQPLGLPLDGRRPVSEDAVAACIRLLESGRIVAIKGLGGFHLACRADSPSAVVRLRERKLREEKPFAVMLRDLEVLKRCAVPSESEQQLLQGAERPIVILGSRLAGSAIAPEVAPRVRTLGVMLPYTPLQHLLFHGAAYDALVMTSGNRREEPICVGNQEAREKLGKIADAFLLHDRDICLRADDSIVRVLGGQTVMIRRARGYVPEALPAGCRVDGVVALGGILKSTITIGKGDMCYTSQYLGATDNLETMHNLEQVLGHLLRILEVRPAVCVVDMHPDNPTRRVADGMGLPLEIVQHHHAHAVACMAENEVTGEALCVIYDGTGYGEDGTVWGGEILRAHRSGYERLSHFAAMPMPGADAAVRNPGRMALGALFARLGEEASQACPWMPAEERQAIFDLVRARLNSPLTSSAGRLFDAAAAVLDICRRRTYEGQPAIELEGMADSGEEVEYDISLQEEGGSLIMDGVAILIQAWHDVRCGTPVPRVSARFHNSVAHLTAVAVGRLAEATGIDTVCLSGGCFQNALLFDRLLRKLNAMKLKVRVHRVLPPNDECVSFGQAVVAATRRG